MKLNTHSKVAGRFKLEVSGGERGRVNLGEELGHDGGWIDNLILDAGLEMLVANTALHNATNSSSNCTYEKIALGTGNSSPNPAQSTLDNGLVATDRGRGFQLGYDVVGGFGWRRCSVQFDQGAAAGTWAEIGAHPRFVINLSTGAPGAATANNGTATLFSRALIVDSMGNPTTITVLPNEFLTCTYELRMWRVNPAGPILVQYDDDGTPVDCYVTCTYPTSTAADSLGNAPSAGRYSFVPGSWSPTAGGSTLGALGLSGSGLAYNEIVANFGLTQGNPGFETLQWVSGAGAQDCLLPRFTTFTFDPPITKTNEFTLSITIRNYIGRR